MSKTLHRRLLVPTCFHLPSESLESSYKDNTGRELPFYLLTKKDCDMVANKMIGEKKKPPLHEERILNVAELKKL